MVNKSEKTITEKYVEEGYLVISSGWPDIVAIKTHKNHIEMIVDEVKTVSRAFGGGWQKQPFAKNQKRAAAILKKLEGKPVYITYRSSEVSSNYVPHRTSVTSEKHGVQNFIKIRTQLDPTGIVTKEKLYREYHTWCLITAHTPLTKGSFSKALNQLQLKPNLATQRRLKHLATTRRTINGVRTWCWAGIKLKEASE